MPDDMTMKASTEWHMSKCSNMTIKHVLFPAESGDNLCSESVAYITILWSKECYLN